MDIVQRCRDGGLACVYNRPTSHTSHQHSPLLKEQAQPGPEITPAGTASHTTFTTQVNAAINARLGVAPQARPSLVPMADAPLFGFLPSRRISAAEASSDQQVLPPRKQADYLMEIYWHHVHPIEPFLDRQRFNRFYLDVFEGTAPETNADEPILFGILNTIFALTTQLQEDKPAEERERTSNRYFQRAWAGVGPDALSCDGPGSVCLVQCLLLMGRYLQCTNNSHQMWMVVGSAVRMAQSLGLHNHDSLATSEVPPADRAFRVCLWNSCVYMDRIVSWVLGRSSTVPFVVSPQSVDPATSTYFIKTLELYEICNHIALSQAPPQHNEFSENIGLPVLYKHRDQMKNICQLDECLTKWEKSLPPSLICDHSVAKTDVSAYRKANYLRFRLLHSRIILFRPMLIRFCQSQLESKLRSDSNLSENFVRDCASMCVGIAQSMVSQIDKCCQVDASSVGLLPWWYRIFYLHLASTVLVIAHLRTELLAPTSASKHWHDAMAGLQAHEHLSPFIKQCVASFQSLAAKVSEITVPKQDSSLAAPAMANIQDIFHDMSSLDNFLFGMDEMSWIDNFVEP
ncbi:hypothetical protein NLG97_g3970 [Lecanicillium saksenae]|uniref:Uncharacterized protein n=1 Tax=Lecanicillium saksenae TaxID=468837 RepID=A0ACC1QYD1_9HYPO|nr:hypothetical protein NLG97_g3970 [Lecanicillium saksenae]